MQQEIHRLNAKLRTFPVDSPERKMIQECLDALKPKPQVKLHVAEDSLCESCE